MTGSTIGHYEVQEQLGAGGMGVVYKALDTQLDRIVALKFLPQHLSDDEPAKRRFIQEAKAASALDHANICGIYHIGETDSGQVYIAMSFYDGQTLKYHMANGPLPEQEAVSIAKQLASGLSRAHAAGIVHRDIKPANVMVTSHGEVKILDFGIAKLGSSSDLTQEGSTLGTVSYMSPEQARGESVGPAADLWSLGVVLYEMLSGRRPFEATYDQALLYAILNESATDILEAAPDTSPETAETVRRLLSKSAKDRPETAAEVIKMLGGATGTVYTDSSYAGAQGQMVLPASMMRVVLIFAVSGVVGLGLVYAAMILLGLPDWVFPAGVLLLLAGAPVTLYASKLERNRAGMDTGEKKRLSGLSSWLTLRKAAMGGVFALAGLGLLAGAFMIMRTMGIGPAATLLSSGALAADDIIVVADFDDQTQAGNMGASIAQALKVDLSQSSIVSIMDDATIKDVLVRMEISGDTLISAGIAQEIAQREGAKAVVVGEISSLGSNYVLSLRLIESDSGRDLISLRETAKTDADIVDALDKLSAGLREQLGESLISIRGGESLAQVTTGSLEALRLYTLAVKARNRSDADNGIRYALEAVAIDPDFASAYRMLASFENNRHGSYSKMIEYARAAYEHRDRLTPDERFSAIDGYYTWVERSMKKRVPELEDRLKEDPSNVRAANGLSLFYRYTGDREKALHYSHEVIRIVPKETLGYINSYYAYTELGQWDKAQAMVDSVVAIEPEFEGRSWMQQVIYAEQSGNYEAALDSFNVAFDSYTDAGTGYFIANYIASIHAMLGQYDKADQALKASAEINRTMDNPEGILWDRMFFIAYRYFADGDLESANRAMEEAFREVDPSSLDTLSREYSTRGYAFAALGREDDARAVVAEQKRYVPQNWLIEDDTENLTEGMLALNDGRFDVAVEKLEWVRANMNNVPRFYEFELGTAYIAAGRLEDAARILESAARGTGWQSLLGDMGTSTLAYRALGETYDKLGRTEDAIEAYEMFVARWKNADAVLRPQVEAVEDRISQLVAQRSTDQ